jgi:hypothetical protein
MFGYLIFLPIERFQADPSILVYWTISFGSWTFVSELNIQPISATVGSISQSVQYIAR